MSYALALYGILLLLCSFGFAEKKHITLWLVGDSTIAKKDPRTYPETGWGMPFVQMWDSTVTVDNRAMNGRSTRTFIEEKRWDAILEKLQPDDYVFIQFGHNDEVPTKKSYVTEEQFRNYLIKYVEETRQKKAFPVLITPVARRKFDSVGHIVDTHEKYAAILRSVAKDKDVPLIDLCEKSMALLQQMGMDASAHLYNQLQPGEHPNYPQGKIDDTHFSELGARKMAEIVLAEIRKQNHELTSRIAPKFQKK